jgi:hypothetical protein
VTPLSQFIARIETLGRAGIVTSICYGPSAGVIRWSVLCGHQPSGAEFTRAFAARDFQHCVEIAELEAARRGWWVP